MLILFVLAVTLLCGTVKAVGAVNTFASSGAEIAMELTTQKVLLENNADEKLPMASTTKIITAIIIVEDCNLDEVITVADEAVGTEGSSIYLKRGEQIDVRDLLYGLMLRSGNDSAVALAIHHSGSIEKFAEEMNRRVKKMGAMDTVLTNPSGLPDDGHYTTARDLCKIACYAMRNGTFKEIVSAENYAGKFRSFSNKNKMLKNYEGANGVKTGFTVKAGRCLVSSAERNGMDVVTVVLNCYDMYARSSEILDKCFADNKLLKLDVDRVFISDKVLCKLQNTKNIVINNEQTLRLEVKPLNNIEYTDYDGAAAELIIYDENGLIFKDKLYRIIDN